MKKVVNIKQLNQAQEMMDNANVPKDGRIYRYMDEDGEMIEVKSNNNPTIKGLFPCLRGNP